MIYRLKHGKFWFSHIVYNNFTTMVSTEMTLWFLSCLENFLTDSLDTLSKGALFFEQIHKVFKNKVQWCSTPLTGHTHYYDHLTHIQIKYILKSHSPKIPLIRCQYRIKQGVQIIVYGGHQESHALSSISKPFVA